MEDTNDPYASLLRQAQHTEREQNRDLEPRGSQESAVSERGRDPRAGSPSVVKREEQESLPSLEKPRSQGQAESDSERRVKDFT